MDNQLNRQDISRKSHVQSRLKPDNNIPWQTDQLKPSPDANNRQPDLLKAATHTVHEIERDL